MKKILHSLIAILATVGIAWATNIIPTPLPYIFQNGTVADATQVNADLNTIVNSINAGAASSGANSDITSLNTLDHVTVTNAVTAGTVSATKVTGTAGASAVALQTNLGLANLGVNGGTPTLQVDGNLNIVATAASAAGVSAPYTTGGSVALPAGAGVRATNVASVRATVTGGGLSQAFNGASATLISGVLTVNFSNGINNGNYQLFAMPCLSAGSAILIPIVTTKGTSSFQVTYLNPAGVATNCASEMDVAAIGGW